MQGISERHREIGVVAFLSLLALVRVVAFGAAFPLFHHVDEPEHIDLVHKLARGHLPSQEGERIDAALAGQMALLRSPEYLADEEVLARGKAMTPIWQRPAEVQVGDRERVAGRIAQRPNHEVASPPVFYGFSALWLAAERAVGVGEARALYGLRLVSALGLLVLVLGSYVVCAQIFPERRALRLGVPMLLAFFPQDLFFSVSPDAWAPVLGMGLLALLVRWRFAPPPGPSWRISVALGVAMAACFLTKLSNLPVVAVALWVVSAEAWRSRKERVGLSRVGCVALVAGVPVVSWLGRNLAVFGSWTGTAGKVEALTWSPRPLFPLSDFFSHPVFSFTGAGTFVSELSATFWRGELYWHGARLSLSWVDALFLGVGLLCLASVALLPAPSTRNPARALLRWSGGSLALSFLLLVALSLAFDFGSSRFPSAVHPYFTSGRLIAVVLFPFALLLVEGIDRVFASAVRLDSWEPAWGTLGVVALISLLALGSEVWLTAPVFGSPYNYFALPASLR